MARSVSANKPTFAAEAGNSDRKRRAILQAAMSVFLKSGFLGASMDEIAALAQVSKQTVYKQFSNKESLFVEIVTSMTDTASNTVHNNVPELTESGGIAEYLQLYALRQLTVVLTPPLMQLRRLVIGEVSRFPELAQILYERGPQRAIASFAKVLEHLEDPRKALKLLRGAIRDGGRLFVNVPLNSPSPDHIYLLSAPDEVNELVESSGFRVKSLELFATQGTRIERALANKVSLSAGVVAVPA